MKLIRLKLLQSYKSLQPFEWVFPRDGSTVSRIDPICLVGVNGSGKSNFMELVAEIFCYLELISLPYKRIPAALKKSTAEFELEYELPTPAGAGRKHVKVLKKDNRPASFYIVEEDAETLIVNENEKFQLLPTRIIAYSSGQNETLSFPFFRAQTLYSAEVAHQALEDISSQKEQIVDTRSMCMDYDSNAAIVLANFLFQPREKLKIFDEFLRVVDISSFRIVVRFNREGKRPLIKRTPEIDGYVEKLKRCSVMLESGGSNDVWKFDYLVNEGTRAAFRANFFSAHDFFLALHKLSLLNSLCLSKVDRTWHLKRGAALGILAKPPTVAPEDMVFRIEELKLRIREPDQEIDYVGISDGEHQFMHIVGTVMMMDEPGVIFLLDEPETHLNPQWRSKLITALNEVVKNRDQEFIISTHSPYIVSDCRGYNVYQFVREGSLIKMEQCRFETFGSSFQYLLTRLFGMEHSMSQQALDQLQEVLKSNDKDALIAAASGFGESFEKQHLYQRIAELQPKKEA